MWKLHVDVSTSLSAAFFSSVQPKFYFLMQAFELPELRVPFPENERCLSVRVVGGKSWIHR